LRSSIGVVYREDVIVLDLAREKDPEVLRQAALLLEQENRKLVDKVIELTRKLAAAEGREAQQLEFELAKLQEQLAVRNKALFGPKSERRSRNGNGDGADSDEGKQPQRGHGPRSQPSLPIVETPHELDAADRTCPSCGRQLDEWEGQAEISEEVDVVERQFVIRRHVRKKYRCDCVGCVETAPGPLKLVPGGRYSIDFAIEVAADKYLDHAPLTRQARKMVREGLEVDSQVLWDQILALGSALRPAYDRLHGHQLAKDMLGADETKWRLMRMKKVGPESKTWQVWTLSSDDAVYYRLQDSRGTEAARRILAGFEGVVMCDGYKAYTDLAKSGERFTVAHCWSHARRKLIEIEAFFPKDARQGIDLIAELYEVERSCPAGRLGDELRRKLRDERSRAIVARIQKWALEVRALPESGLAKAIEYMSGIWSGLIRFLEDPRIPLDNNSTERAIRGVVIGRKNHYGSRSQRGTEIAAILYSLIESAKISGLDPKRYLRTAVHAALGNDTIPLPHELRDKLQAPSADDC
jgi:transposase